MEPNSVPRGLTARLIAARLLGILILLPASFAEASDRYRWDIKTGADDQAQSVSRQSSASVELLNRVARPPRGTDPEVRSAPVEQTLYRVTGKLLMFRLEADGDIHLVIQDEETDATLIAEIPDPDEVTAESPWLDAIEAARQQFEEQFHPTSSRQDGEHREISLFGVGFWDKRHGAEGAADNGIELHPVLSYSCP